MRAKILVITATLGNRETLTRTIDSVRKIGGDNVRHVLVAPEECIPALRVKYNNIECIPEDKTKHGIYAALNTGFETFAHEYDYLTFINDDDYWLPPFRVLIDAILEDGSLDFVYARTKYVDENNKIIGEQTSSSNFKQFIPLLKSGIVQLTQQSTILRSSFYFKIGGFDESYKLVADTKFWALLSLENLKFKYFNKCCAAYMIQEGQLSSDKSTQSREKERLLSELPQYGKVSIYYNKIRFRLCNIGVYVKRLISVRQIECPFTTASAKNH